MEFNNQNGLILPNEILEMVVKKADAGTTLKLLQSAKVFEHMLDEKNWKLLYVFRWHKKILGHSNYNDQELMSKIEQYLRVSPNEYVEEQFYDKDNAWKNRYKHRAQLEHEGIKPDQDLFSDLDLCQLDKESLTLYEVNYNCDAIQYSNIAKVVAKIKVELTDPDLLDDSEEANDENEEFVEYDSNIIYNAIIIGHTGAPVKVRIETMPKILNPVDSVRRMGCSTLLLAYNEKNHIWDVVMAHFFRWTLQKESIYYYKPYCATLTKALFDQERIHHQLSWLIPDPDYNADLLAFISAAAGVSEDYLSDKFCRYCVQLD